MPSEFELVLGGVDSAGYVDAAVFDRPTPMSSILTVPLSSTMNSPSDAFDGDSFHRQNRLGRFPSLHQPSRRNAVWEGRNGGGVISTCFGRHWQEGPWIDVELNCTPDVFTSRLSQASQGWDL